MGVLKGAVDDHDVNTRHLTCLVFHHLFDQLPGALSEEPVRQLYPELLKRFDDSSDIVRRSVCMAMKGFLRAAPPQHFAGTTIDYMLDCLFVHLDDPDPIMQQAVAMWCVRPCTSTPGLCARRQPRCASASVTR